MTAHGALINSILLALSPYGHVWGNNTGALRDTTGRVVRYGQVGSADILGCIGGKFLAIECKVGRDRLSPAQKAWGAAIIRSGGLWCEARSVDDALALVRLEAPQALS